MAAARADGNCPCTNHKSQFIGIRYVAQASYLAQAGNDRTFDTQPVLPISEQQAFNRSLYGTLIPLPTLVFTLPGLIAGPSLGYFYGGKPGRAWTGIGLRTAGVGGMVSSFAICGWDCGPGDDSYDLAWAVFIASGALVVGSAVYDIATVKGAVRDRNERLLGDRWEISPRYFSRSRGIGLQVRFALR
jgi:hypothetical protein